MSNAAGGATNFQSPVRKGPSSSQKKASASAFDSPQAQGSSINSPLPETQPEWDDIFWNPELKKEARPMFVLSD
jgi:hypothetical protein